MGVAIRIASRYGKNNLYGAGEMARNAAALEKSHPLYEASKRGEEIERKMLTAEGGALSGKRFSEKLGITPLELGRMRKRNEVFWMEVGGDYVYPSFQLDGSGFLPGIRDVLDAFAVDDEWMRVNFMLTGDLRLNGWRPIDALREGMIEEVKISAGVYGEHGAA